jgi:hypothetical protein
MIGQRLESGDRWWHTIVANIEACNAFVVVMSPTAEKSPWVQKEIIRAHDMRKPILPLLLRGECLSILADTQYAAVTDGQLPAAEFYERLRDAGSFGDLQSG